MKKRFFRFAALGATAAALCCTPVSAIKAAVEVTFEPGPSNTLHYRTFKFYRIFAVQPGATADTAQYSFDPTTQAAVQAFIGTETGKAAAQITAMEAAEYLSSLMENAADPGQIHTPVSLASSKFRSLIKTLNDHGVSPTSVTIPDRPWCNNQPYTVSDIQEGFYLIDEDTNDWQAQTPSSHTIARLITENITIQPKNAQTPVLNTTVFEDEHGIRWNDIADVDRGQILPFQASFNIPQISGYDYFWTVRYQVRLDPHLIYDPDSIQVQITDGTITKTLAKDQDYTIETIETSDTSFNVYFTDLKKIADREFYEGSGNEVHPYGQTVIVRYDARLSENLPVVLGRPGMESRGRLEYSFDPENPSKLSLAPWDAVITYSFGLNFAIQNSTTNAPVSDGQFRLYKDRAATQEIFFTKEADRYMVLHQDAISKGAVPTGEPLTADSQGKIQIEGIDRGTYFLKEVNNPSGYYALTDPIEITINPIYPDDRGRFLCGQGTSALFELKGSAYVVKYGSDVSTEKIQAAGNVDTGTLEFPIYKKPIPKLPLTGSQSTLLIIGTGMILAAAGLYGWKKTRKQTSSASYDH